MIRTLSQATAQHALRQASERRTQQQRDDQRRSREHFLQSRNERRTALSPQVSRNQENPAPVRNAVRSEAKRPLREEDDLFSALLENDDPATPLLIFNEAGSDPQQGFSQLDETAGQSAPPAMAMWQEIEPALISALGEAPQDAMMLTLMLPKLGNVDAYMAVLPGGGWDIALHLQPGSWQALLPHQERCRLSLRQRMACRVRLRFERRSPGER